ncbi:hypothetical protein [Dyella sp.]|jgi:hypothetical protein|uniref:hypothetical protein n=1 Tax=Dyella sp. TaxID=1869338 RepID=UPI002D78ABE1|nr:hypothetical protein [Dyella sp.]HET6430855.1 hypothetical protein [Dyella sp.]
MHVLPLLAGLAILALAFYWQHRRVRAMTAEWAAAHGYRILDIRLAWFLPLRMWLTTSDAQVVVRVKIYDERSRRVRSGWLRLGAYWRGLADGDSAQVRWEDG